MDKGLSFQSIDAFAELLPRFRPLFEDEWENKWWPERLRARRTEAVTETVGVS
jgi:hypothetical protein